MTVEIEVRGRHGGTAFVDDQDAELVGQYTWWGIKSNTRIYVCRSSNAGNWRRMHRLIMQAPPGQLVDHANRDTFDNRRINLRFCTPSQSIANRVSENMTGYRGVYHKSASFFARCWHSGARHRGPLRKSAEDAARDYDALASEIYGEFAILNFPVTPATPEV